MEAVILSLKDLEMRHPQPQGEEQPPSVRPDSSKSSQKDENPESASSAERHDLLKTESISTSVQQCGLSKTESTSISTTKTQVSELKHQTPTTREPSTGPVPDAPPSLKQSESSGPSTQDVTSSSSQSSSETDLSAKTKATLTVERNPASNVMDGLIRRWDFSFFRNNQSR